MRDPLYREVAHVIMDTGTQSLKSLVNKLEQRLFVDSGYSQNEPPSC
jgi:shikimate kinase